MNETISELSKKDKIANDKAEVAIEGSGPVFSMPVYIQRYYAVRDILSKELEIKKVVDFGCSEGKFFKYLRKLVSVDEIALVDVDEYALQSASYKARPLMWDYINKREKPLTVKLYLGDVTKPDPVIFNFDAVTCIELIEHLSPDVLEDFCRSIFGIIQPKIAIFTTPNSDFNVLFPGFNGFRHWDHKFEWSKQQFQEWCQDIISKYPLYNVEFDGVGDPPEESRHVGYCTQIGIFRKSNTSEAVKHVSDNQEPYELVDEFLYPGKDTGLSNCDET